MKIKDETFWVVTPCSVVVGYQRSETSDTVSQPRRPQLGTNRYSLNREILLWNPVDHRNNHKISSL